MMPEENDKKSFLSIEDLAGISKPLTALINAIQLGIGTIFKPYIVKKSGAAKADVIRTIAETIDATPNKNLEITYNDGNIAIRNKPEGIALTEVQLEERILSRLGHQDLRKQKNIECITTLAVTEMANSNEVPKATPSEDWIIRFFNYAQDVCNEELQQIWGKILSGEVKRPGKFSLRTLDFIRNITVKEAQSIEKIAKIAILSHGYIIPTMAEWLEKNRAVKENELLYLSELGIINPNSLSILPFQDTKFHLYNGNHALTIHSTEKHRALSMNIRTFTQIGNELLSIIDVKTDHEYLREIGGHCFKHNMDATISIITSSSVEGVKLKVVEKINSNATLADLIILEPLEW